MRCMSQCPTNAIQGGQECQLAFEQAIRPPAGTVAVVRLCVGYVHPMSLTSNSVPQDAQWTSESTVSVWALAATEPSLISNEPSYSSLMVTDRGLVRSAPQRGQLGSTAARFIGSSSHSGHVDSTEIDADRQIGKPVGEVDVGGGSAVAWLAAGGHHPHPTQRPDAVVASPVGRSHAAESGAAAHCNFEHRTMRVESFNCWRQRAVGGRRQWRTIQVTVLGLKQRG